MNRILTLITMTLCCLTITAQSQVYELHPVLGDTIDNLEIKKYYLFAEHIGESLDYLIIRKNKEIYALEGIVDRTIVLNIQVREDEILQQKERVEKLFNYFNFVLKKDSFNIGEPKSGSLISDTAKISNINLNIMTPEFIRSIKKDNKRKFWEEKRKETKSNQEKGMIF